MNDIEAVNLLINEGLLVEATVKNFIRSGEPTNLMKIVHRCLQHDNYCQRVYLDAIFNNRQNLSQVIDKNYRSLFTNQYEGRKRFISVTKEGYDLYKEAMENLGNEPLPWREPHSKTTAPVIEMSEFEEEIMRTMNEALSVAAERVMRGKGYAEDTPDGVFSDIRRQVKDYVVKKWGA